MGQVSTIGLDFAMRVFQAHGADTSGRTVCRKRLVRAKLIEFLACELGTLGHTARLIPPAYVKRQKNDLIALE